ncbi:MAG: FtsX-like permease family protein [Bacteroidota bacterium]
MSYSSFIARRYLQSRNNNGFISFITAIAITGVALGTAALIITLSVLGGFEREITQKVIGFTSHVQIQGFQSIPLTNHIQNALLIEDSIEEVQGVAPFVSREALIRSRESVDGIFLKGLDPVRDFSSVGRFIVQGKYEVSRQPGTLPSLVIGRKLARKLSLSIGDKATVFGIGRGVDIGQMRARQFRVSGIYESGMAEYDDVYAFTSIEDAQSVFQMGNTISGYDILLTDVDSAEVVASKIEQLLGYPHYGRTVFQNYRNLFTWIELQKEPVPIILGLIIIVATVNIIGTLLMMVLEKTREIGVLIALGATRWGIARIFLRQGLTIAITGTLIGNALGFILCYLQLELGFFSLPSDIYFMTSVPILLRPEYFIIVSLVSIGLCVVSSLLPARLASGLNPINAIRFA